MGDKSDNLNLNKRAYKEKNKFDVIRYNMEGTFDSCLTITPPYGFRISRESAFRFDQISGAWSMTTDDNFHDEDTMYNNIT